MSDPQASWRTELGYPVPDGVCVLYESLKHYDGGGAGNWVYRVRVQEWDLKDSRRTLGLRLGLSDEFLRTYPEAKDKAREILLRRVRAGRLNVKPEGQDLLCMALTIDELNELRTPRCLDPCAADTYSPPPTPGPDALEGPIEPLRRRVNALEERLKSTLECLVGSEDDARRARAACLERRERGRLELDAVRKHLLDIDDQLKAMASRIANLEDAHKVDGMKFQSVRDALEILM
jgi:hypothetical protein